MNGRSLTKKKMLLFSFIPKNSLFLCFTPQSLRNRKNAWRTAGGSLHAAGSGTTQCRGTPQIAHWAMSAGVYKIFQHGERALRTHYNSL